MKHFMVSHFDWHWAVGTGYWSLHIFIWWILPFFTVLYCCYWLSHCVCSWLMLLQAVVAGCLLTVWVAEPNWASPLHCTAASRCLGLLCPLLPWLWTNQHILGRERPTVLYRPQTRPVSGPGWHQNIYINIIIIWGNWGELGESVSSSDCENVRVI